MRGEDALRKASAELAAAGIEQPWREARLLMGFLSGDRYGLRLAPEDPVDAAAFSALVQRRAAREPMAFITGTSGFWTLDVTVSPATLIPRPDSETLIEAALAGFPDRCAVRRLLDLGTGTGCLLLAALEEFPAAFGVGVDLSPAAAGLARNNAHACGLAARSAFVAGNWTAAIAAKFDLILCNPPYIATALIRDLMPEVSRFEPQRALDGGMDGLNAYKIVVPRLPALLEPGGIAILELGQGQAPEVAGLARRAGFDHVTGRSDLGGTLRALSLATKAPCEKLFGNTFVGS